METDFFLRGGGRDCLALSRFFGVLPERFEPHPPYRLTEGYKLRRSVETDTDTEGGRDARVRSPRKRERGSLPFNPVRLVPPSNVLGSPFCFRSVVLCCSVPLGIWECPDRKESWVL